MLFRSKAYSDAAKIAEETVKHAEQKASEVEDIDVNTSAISNLSPTKNLVPWFMFTAFLFVLFIFTIRRVIKRIPDKTDEILPPIIEVSSHSRFDQLVSEEKLKAKRKAPKSRSKSVKKSSKVKKQRKSAPTRKKRASR